jgi:hypothetical protein
VFEAIEAQRVAIDAIMHPLDHRDDATLRLGRG